MRDPTHWGDEVPIDIEWGIIVASINEAITRMRRLTGSHEQRIVAGTAALRRRLIAELLRIPIERVGLWGEFRYRGVPIDVNPLLRANQVVIVALPPA